MAEIGSMKRRKPWLAALLSLLNTAWGQFYCGHWQRGLLLLAVDLLLGAALIFNMGSFVAFVGLGLVLILFNIYVAVNAYLAARKAGEYVLGPCNRWWIYGLLVASSLLIGAGMDAANQYKTYQIPSRSMLQTLQVGDYLMAEKLSPGDAVNRGDILVFSFPQDPNRNFIKRAIAFGGETVEMKGGTVYINGKGLDEPYVYFKNSAANPKVDNLPLTPVPDGHVFFMGDNRRASHDSRFFGSVDRRNVIARAGYLYVPGDGDWGRWGKVIR